jgi:hypothetical protein
VEHIGDEMDENNQDIYGNSTLLADGQVILATAESTLHKGLHTVINVSLRHNFKISVEKQSTGYLLNIP